VIEPTARLIVPGVALVVLAAVGAVARPRSGRYTRWAPELVALVALGLTGWQLLDGGAGAGTWWEAASDPRGLWLVGLAALVGVGARRIPAGPWAAVLGGLTVGAVPTTALLAPLTSSPGQAARVALLATAASAISPFGGPAQLLLGEADLLYTLWALPPALVAGAMVWTRTPRGPSRRLPLALVGAGVGLALVAGPTPGLGFAVLAGAVTSRGTAAPTAPTLRRLAPLRWAVAVWLLVTAVLLSGGVWFVGRGLAWFASHQSGAALVGVCALLGSFLEPTVLATLLARGASLAAGPTVEVRHLVALGLAFAPVQALAVASLAQGRRVFAVGLPLWLAQIAVVLAWAALTG